MQLRKENLKKIQACKGFEPLTSAIPVQHSTSSYIWFSYIHNFIILATAEVACITAMIFLQIIFLVYSMFVHFCFSSLLSWLHQGLVWSSIGQFRREKGTGAELRPALVSGNVTGDELVSYWSIFCVVPSDSPRSLFETFLGPDSFSFLKWRISF